MKFKLEKAKRIANAAQDKFNQINGTAYKWKAFVEGDTLRLNWSYNDLDFLITTGDSKAGDEFVKSYDPQQGKTLKYYLIGKEFYHDQPDLQSGVDRIIYRTVMKVNEEY